MRDFLALVLVWTACVAASPALPRSVSLGISASARADGHGLTIDQVAPGSPAAEFGVATGDTLMAINGTAIRSGADLVQAARSLKGGDLVRMAVVRSGRRIELEGSARGRPFETYEHASARYGAVPFHDEFLRDILVQPRTPAKGAPVVFLMQGFSCASVESSDRLHPYRQIVSGLAARGIAVYRIEKPGMGDSRGSEECSEIGLETELGAFEAGYLALQKHHGFAARQIFIFGHSVGGMEAPFIAARHAPPRGIAVYGVAARNWYDYVLDVVRIQDVLLSGADPVERSVASEAAREPLRRLYLQRQSPAEVAAANPEAAEMLRQTHDWDGGDHLFGRHYRFLQDLAALAQTRAWKESKTNVLALYGESDLIALSGEDARLIAPSPTTTGPAAAPMSSSRGSSTG